MSGNHTHKWKTKKRKSAKKKHQFYLNKKRIGIYNKYKVRNKRAVKRRELLFLLLVVVCFVWLTQYKTHRVTGNSMLPTLENNDRIIVKKGNRPDRYDLITFDPEISDASSYVKRIVAMPGDQLWTEGNAVYLRPKKAGKWVLNTANPMTAEELPDSTLKVIVSDEVFQKLRNTNKIPDGSYFVLGDNRSASKDSREMGLIQETQIEGIVSFRYFPFTKIGQVK